MKTKFILLVIATGVIVAILFLSPRSTSQVKVAQPSITPTPIAYAYTPKIVSTKPDPLEEAIISSTEVLEITFNRPLENEGELKIRIDPKVDFEIKLSQDRKTGKIIPKKPYELGATYTLFIGPDSKFDGVGEWKQEKIYHFKTVKYRGV